MRKGAKPTKAAQNYFVVIIVFVLFIDLSFFFFFPVGIWIFFFKFCLLSFFRSFLVFQLAFTASLQFFFYLYFLFYLSSLSLLSLSISPFPPFPPAALRRSHGAPCGTRAAAQPPLPTPVRDSPPPPRASRCLLAQPS